MHFIQSELRYHATSLENLSDLLFKINEKEPKEYFEDIIKNYNIDVDLKDLEINLNEVKRKKREKEESQNEKES